MVQTVREDGLFWTAVLQGSQVQSRIILYGVLMHNYFLEISSMKNIMNCPVLCTTFEGKLKYSEVCV